MVLIFWLKNTSKMITSTLFWQLFPVPVPAVNHKLKHHTHVAFSDTNEISSNAKKKKEKKKEKAAADPVVPLLIQHARVRSTIHVISALIRRLRCDGGSHERNPPVLMEVSLDEPTPK